MNWKDRENGRTDLDGKGPKDAERVESVGILQSFGIHIRKPHGHLGLSTCVDAINFCRIRI